MHCIALAYGTVYSRTHYARALGTRRVVDGSCEDINECTAGSHTCGRWSYCVNTDGSFECPCYPGYTKTASGACVDVAAMYETPLRKALGAATRKQSHRTWYTSPSMYKLKAAAVR